MSRRLRFATILVLSILAAGVSPAAFAEMIYAISSGPGAAQSLIRFDSATPSNLVSGAFISGLQPNEAILGIDFRPQTGELFALGSTSRLYAINPSSGVTTAVSTSSFGPPLLNGASFGFDFNPTIDRIRVVSETNQNLVLNPITGALQLAAIDVFYPAGDVNFGKDPNVVDSAYTNNFFGATSSQLYGIDTGLDALVTQANNTGVLGTIGSLGLDAVAAGGFDISGTSGIAYTAFLGASSSQSGLYTINLATGAATLVGVIDGGLFITALTVAPAPVPEPTSLALAAFGGIALLRFRKR